MRHLCVKLSKLLAVGLAVTLAPVVAERAFAADVFHGIYFATYSGCGISGGGFAVFAEPQTAGGNAARKLQWGTRTQIFSTYNIGSSQPLTIATDGTFTIFVDYNVVGSGTFTATGVSGTLTDTSNNTTCGSFGGSKESKAGPIFDAAGYYSGNLSGKLFATSGALYRRTSGNVQAIVAPSGRLAIYTYAAADTVSKSDSGTFYTSGVSADSISIDGTLTASTQIAGAISRNTFNAKGTFDGYIIYCLSIFGCAALDHSGTWSMARLDAWINRLPVVIDDDYETRRKIFAVSQAKGVLANDHDPDGDPLTAILESGTSHGTLALSADGSFTYTPQQGFLGADAFSYRVSDGLEMSDAAAVSITVEPLTLAPIFGVLLD